MHFLRPFRLSRGGAYGLPLVLHFLRPPVFFGERRWTAARLALPAPTPSFSVGADGLPLVSHVLRPLDRTFRLGRWALEDSHSLYTFCAHLIVQSVFSGRRMIVARFAHLASTIYSTLDVDAAIDCRSSHTSWVITDAANDCRSSRTSCAHDIFFGGRQLCE